MATKLYLRTTPRLGVWTSGGNLATARYYLAGCGTQTTGLSFGGTTGAVSAVTEEYDGTSWSSGGALATARQALAGCGTQTAGLSFGGFIAAVSAVTEEYDGTSWTSGGNLATARQTLAGCGTQTVGLSFGGNTGTNSAVTEEYDGTSWSSGGALATARQALAGCGTQTTGLSFGGISAAPSAVTQEYTRLSDSVINLGTWASGGALVTARQTLAGCGTQTAGLSFGGAVVAVSAVTEEYDGTSWASGGALATARQYLAGCGTQTAGLSFGGVISLVSALTEEYDGTSWTSGGALATARQALAGCGTQTSGLSFGGDTGTASAVTEEYDGTSWSSGGNLATSRIGLAGCGTQTAGLSFGGFVAAVSAVTEEYDGTSWTSGVALATARSGLAGCGIQTAGLSFGGNPGATYSAVTEEYDGSVWSSGGSLATARNSLAGTGTQTAGLSFGGTNGSNSAVTEEYGGVSSLLNTPGYFPTSEQSASTTNWTTADSTLRIAHTTIGSSQQSIAGTTQNVATAQSGFVGMWCTDTLDVAQTVGGGSIVFLTAEKESSSNVNFWPNGLEIYVWRPSTGAKVGTIKSFADTSLGGTEPTGGGSSAETTEQTTYITGITSSAVNALAGDIIVIELWSRHTQGMSTAYTATTYFGGATEYTAENTATTDIAAYVQFSETLTFGISANIPNKLYFLRQAINRASTY